MWWVYQHGEVLVSDGSWQFRQELHEGDSNVRAKFFEFLALSSNGLLEEKIVEGRQDLSLHHGPHLVGFRATLPFARPAPSQERCFVAVVNHHTVLIIFSIASPTVRPVMNVNGVVSNRRPAASLAVWPTDGLGSARVCIVTLPWAMEVEVKGVYDGAEGTGQGSLSLFVVSKLRSQLHHRSMQRKR